MTRTTITMFHVKHYASALEALAAACCHMTQSAGTADLTPIHGRKGQIIIYRVDITVPVKEEA